MKVLRFRAWAGQVGYPCAAIHVGNAYGFDARVFAGMPEEIRLRLLKRAVDRVGHEGSAELGKVEALLVALDRAVARGEPKLEQTLAGAAISLIGGRIRVEPAPPRRSRRPSAS